MGKMLLANGERLVVSGSRVPGHDDTGLDIPVVSLMMGQY